MIGRGRGVAPQSTNSTNSRGKNYTPAMLLNTPDNKEENIAHI